MTATDGREATARATLELRAETFRRIRAFFRARGVLEVDTPALSAAGTSDPALTSLTTRVEALDDAELYLQTSPELAMKRLLATGSGDIYQICRVFRDGELGRWHQPEFMLLEWYRLGFDEHALMDEVFALIASIVEERFPDIGTERLTYSRAFERHVGFDPHRRDAAAREDLGRLIEDRNVDAPTDLDLDSLLDLALAAVVAPSLPRGTATFIHDYPKGQAALAELKGTSPPVAARFELFIEGVEIANGFRELRDSAEQRQRFETDLAARRAAGKPTPPIDEAFLAALAQGLPPCAGVALGLDRLIAIAAGATSLAEVVPFAHERQRKA